jgi:RNA polymerase sigma factor (sigma-70 family)
MDAMLTPNPNSLMKLSDANLISLYKSQGDKQFIGELYKRYAHLILGMCIHYFKDKEAAKDMVLQIFEKLFEELKKRDIDNFKIWLTFVVRNSCISELRKKQTLQRRNDEYNYEMKLRMVETEKEDRMQQEEKMLRLENALNYLNPFQKRCIELFYLKNRSYKEIVELTGCSLNEVKSYIQNGKRNLKLIITDPKQSFYNENE